jgi:GrpB-like predicted nucleotidyltransferase (UPF0157 family)/prolyl-tRNA editing enzyme YbaK/EbsC (Cys-tRNA(Pro) deacylase)
MVTPMDKTETESGVKRFTNFLLSHGVTPDLVELPVTTRSASDAARAVGSELTQIVKSLLFTGIKTKVPVLVLVSGPNRVDLQRLSEIVGEKVHLADPQTVLAVTGYPVGAVPPVGIKEQILTVIDENLSHQPNVWISGGSDHVLAKMPFQELSFLTGGRVTTIDRPLASPVIIMPYDSNWPRLFSTESVRIRAVMGSYLKAIEHVGSTAVPGLAAKPILDILGGVRRLEESPSFIPALEKIGFQYFPEYEIQLPERRYLHRIEDGHAVVHLHLAETSSSFWQNHIKFRDLLIANSSLRDAYGELKAELASKFGNDRIGYTDAKTDFIKRALSMD